MKNRYPLTFVATFSLFCVCSGIDPVSSIANSFPPLLLEQAFFSRNETPAEGAALIAEAGKRLTQYQSVKADLSERISIQDHSFTAIGSYLQGKGNQLRMEMTVKLGRNRGSLLEICDGQILWTHHKIIDQTQVTRRDVKKILQAAEQSGGRFSESSMIADLGLGGLAGVLSGIANDMNFSTPAKQEIDGTPVLVIEGKWKDEFLARFRSDQKNSPKEIRLPAFVPDQVQVAFQEDNLFPRRITYLKQGPGGKISSPMLVLEFSKVVLNGPVSIEQFQYVPDQGNPADVTEVYLRRIAEAGQKNAPVAPPKPAQN